MLTPEAAGRWLAEHYGDRAGPALPLGAGAWSTAFRFELDGLPKVVRFGRHGEDFAKDQWMAAHARAALPIPAVHELGTIPDGYYAISDLVPGGALDDLDGAAMRAVLPGLLDALDALAAVDVSGQAGYGGWGPDGQAHLEHWREALLHISGDRTAGWRETLATDPSASAAFARGFARLQALVPRIPDIRQVIHGDLLAHNVLVDGDRIAGVIDWGNSLYGDALYDAAWLIYWWPWYPAWGGIDIRAELEGRWTARGPLPADLEHRLHCYQLYIGLDSMAYTAFTGNREQLARNAAQVNALAGR